MASFQYNCGACDFKSDCVDSRMDHRKEKHSNRFYVHGRCGICRAVFSDLFTFLDHFEEIHPVQLGILLDKGREMIIYSTPCPLSFVYRTFIGIEEEPKMDYTDADCLHSLVRLVVLELGISGSDSEDEDEHEDGYEPPPSLSRPSDGENRRNDAIIGSDEHSASLNCVDGDTVQIYDNLTVEEQPPLMESDEEDLNPPNDVCLVTPIIPGNSEQKPVINIAADSQQPQLYNQELLRKEQKKQREKLEQHWAEKRRQEQLMANYPMQTERQQKEQQMRQQEQLINGEISAATRIPTAAAATATDATATGTAAAAATAT
ncbi:hypothetical protein PENTCL1PPCAC_1995 [Pristionchus entomophagus]|uniref:C2H2-type domain-containing protein n=1 Tax=Pristionchus entomophagus TaxID=358040 RepID=A0AAV5SAL1_9BILA|nr:hypothetical protein PENTCL1PPCAC_1995 [Pristionchus entomophagus]